LVCTERHDIAEVFTFMSANQARYPVQVMARALGVSRSGFYAFEGRDPSDRDLANAELLEDIKRIHKALKHTYGAPRIHAELADEGVHVGRKRVERLMQEHGIVGVSRRKFVKTMIKGDRVRPALDLVDRNFYAAERNQLWVADITYVPTWVGFLYLAVVSDAFPRRIVGWTMGHDLKTQIVLDAMNMAIGQRRPANVINHSDQGSQYTSIAFGARCKQAGVRPSMGSVGDRAMTTQCARVSSPPSNANCSTDASSEQRPRHAWRSSSSSKAGVTQDAVIRRLDTNHPSTGPQNAGIFQRLAVY